MYTFSPEAVILIAKFEGFVSHPYLDSVNKPTIGYGSTTYNDGRVVTMKDPIIDKDTASSMLLHHLNEIELPKLKQCLTRQDLNQHQIDAIGCLCYNIGENGFCKSTLCNKININAPIEEIRVHWLEWNKANHKVPPGLVTRREIEFNYYIKPI